MSDLGNTGTIVVDGVGILLTITEFTTALSVDNQGTIEATLDGVKVISDPAGLISTATFDINNAGSIRSTVNGSAIRFDVNVASPGSVTIVNQATGLLESSSGDAILITGNSADAITNHGTIIGGVSTGTGANVFDLYTGSSISGLLDGGADSDTVNLRGTGTGTLGSFAGIETINLFDGDWTLGSDGVGAVNFQGGRQTVNLAGSVLADGQFNGTINNFELGDAIDLTGIGLATSATLDANNLLTIEGGSAGPVTLQFDPSQNLDWSHFHLVSDGAGGTRVMLATTVNIDNAGIIEGTAGPAIQITVDELDPGLDATITNTATAIIRGATDGILVLADPADLTATGTFLIDNAGLVETTGSGRAINFDLSLGAPGGVTIVNHETGVITAPGGEAVFIGGTSADVISNMGTISGSVSTGGGADTFDLYTGSSISGLVDGGSGSDTVNLRGSGQGTLNGFANVETINLFGGDWTLGSEGVGSVNFQSGVQTLGLDATVLADGSFTGTINGFALGDTIDLSGVGLATGATLGANNVLTVSGGSTSPITLQLDPTQSFSGLIFQLTSNGAGGTNVELATVISGGGGSDTVTGTVGNDVVSSGNGNDIINSGDGNDRVSAGNGNDVIVAGNGNSILSGENGDDTITAGNGANTVNGGNGNDSVIVGNGNNTIVGDNGNDTISAGHGSNTVNGGNGNDIVSAGDGNNTIVADNGDDTITLGNGANNVNGGNGNDSVTVGNGNNTIVGDNGNDTITTGNGNNTITGGNGNDVITVGNGNNNLNGGNGNDTFILGTGNNILTGGNGNDAFVFREDFGVNTIIDFGGNDRIEFIDVFASFQELQNATHQIGSDAVIVLDAESSVTLVGVSVSSLHSSDFLLS